MDDVSPRGLNLSDGELTLSDQGLNLFNKNVICDSIGAGVIWRVPELPGEQQRM